MDGIVTVLNTPFTEKDCLDLDGLSRNVELAIGDGVAGFLVPAMASEVYKLSRLERREMVATVLQQGRGRVSVIGGAGEADPVARAELVQELVALGCDAILLQIPYRDDEQYRREVLDAAALGPKAIMLQDWDFHGAGLPVPLILRLFEEVESFRCLKVEVAPAGAKYSEVLRATGGRLHVSGGWAVLQMIEALDRGVHAIMPTGMHAVYTTIWSCFHAGKREEAVRLFREILPVLAFVSQHLDISIHFFKRLLFREGIYSTPRAREPILPFDAVHERTAEDLIALAMELNQRCRRDAGVDADQPPSFHHQPGR